MRVIKTTDRGFRQALDLVLERGESALGDVEDAVRDIIGMVREHGDRALCELTERFDRVDVKGRIRVAAREIDEAFESIPKRDRDILKLARKRIEAFHKKQTTGSWTGTDAEGVTLGQLIRPLARAGIYVPGGKAAYPSTVLMNSIPAVVAGVKEIVMVTPPSAGRRKRDINPYVLAAARVAGIKKVYRVGGAQAIAALAYGTRSIPAVDKIVGPGNVYVTAAKRAVFGTVDIDMVAGPSEILIINDGSGKKEVIASDLLSQAEHDEMASSVLITTSPAMANAVKKEVERQLRTLRRRAIARESLAGFGLIIVAKTLKEAMRLSNRIAPEHLELCVKEPETLLPRVQNAGAVFLGHNTPEAAGDYIAGPSHTLPTGRTARFSSPLGVYDFVKSTSVIGFSTGAIRKYGPAIKRFADIEGLDAHARSVGARL